MTYEKCRECPECEVLTVEQGGILLVCPITSRSIFINECIKESKDKKQVKVIITGN